MRVPKGREPYAQQRVPAWKSPIQGRGRPLDHQPRHQSGHRRLGRPGPHRRPHQGELALERHRHLHDARALLQGAGGAGGRQGAGRHHPQRQRGRLHRAAQHGARVQHRGHSARRLQHRPDPASAAEGIPPPFRPAGRRCAASLSRPWGSAGRRTAFGNLFANEGAYPPLRFADRPLTLTAPDCIESRAHRLDL